MTDKQIIIDGINLHGNRKDLTGLKVGKLTCLKPVKTGKNKHSEWLCECECGNFKIAQTYRLLSGRIQSCGDCYHTINHYIPMIKELEKQLKRKEQECEELKKRISNYKCPMDNNADYCGHLEDYGELLEQLEAYKMEAEEGKEINAELKAENEKLKETITEIKEIAEYLMEEDTDNWSSPFEPFIRLDEILQKISEVLND